MMLNKGDIDFIRSSREEIRTNREKEVTLLVRKYKGKHPVTDEPIYDVSMEEISAVVTVVTVGSSVIGNTISMEDGIKIISGDIVVDVNLDDFPEDLLAGEVNSVNYLDVDYKVVSYGILGLGDSNRVEFVGRREF